MMIEPILPSVDEICELMGVTRNEAEDFITTVEVLQHRNLKKKKNDTSHSEHTRFMTDKELEAKVEKFNATMTELRKIKNKMNNIDAELASLNIEITSLERVSDENDPIRLMYKEAAKRANEHRR
jgi:hypothetical protein